MGERFQYSAFNDEVCKECRDCEKRHEKCHSTCTEYLAAKLVIDVLKVDRRRGRDERKGLDTYFINRTTAKAKRKHPSTRYGVARKRR